MAEAALQSVNVLIKVLDNMRKARQEVLIQQKRTKILLTGLKQGLIARITLNGDDISDQSTIPETNTEESSMILQRDEVIINLKQSIDEAIEVFKQIKGRNCLTKYLHSQQDLQNVQQSYQLLQEAYYSLEKEMEIIESAKQQRELKKQLHDAKIMYQNLTSDSAKQFIQNYFEKNFHSIPLSKISKKFVEYVQQENLKLQNEEDKFPLVNLEPQFQKVINNNNTNNVDIGQINKFYTDIWDIQEKKQAFKEFLLSVGQSQIDEYLLIFQLLESVELQSYFNLFKQHHINSNKFLHLTQDMLLKGFKEHIPAPDICTISLAIKDFLAQKQYYESIKDNLNNKMEKLYPFFDKMIAKKEKNELIKQDPKQWQNKLIGWVAYFSKIDQCELYCEGNSGSGGVYLKDGISLRIFYVINYQVADHIPMFMQYHNLDTILITQYGFLDKSGQYQGPYYTKKQEDANDFYYVEQYIDCISSNPKNSKNLHTLDQYGRSVGNKPILKGYQLDTKRQITIRGPLAYDENGCCVMHDKQIEEDFNGQIRIAYFYYGKEISFKEYQEKFNVQKKEDFLNHLDKIAANTNKQQRKQQVLQSEKSFEAPHQTISPQQISINKNIDK